MPADIAITQALTKSRDANAFDERVVRMTSPAAHRFQDAIIDVADTMDTCKLWFESKGVPFTGADLITMAKMVLNRARERADDAKRAEWEKDHQIGEDV